MFKRHSWFRVLLALVAVVVLVGAGMAIFRAGWWQGYRMEREISDEPISKAFPHGDMPRLWGRMPGRHPGLVFPWLMGGLVFRIGGLLVLLIAIGSAFRFLTWRAACAHGGMDWMAHHHPHHPGPGHHPGPMHRSFHGKVRPEEAGCQADDNAEEI
jgi:hypothetical protein